MTHPASTVVVKVLEFLVLAITVGSWLWISFFAMNCVHFDPVA